MDNETCHTRWSERGYTLIEIVIVIVTLGIIAAVAIPRFANISDSAKQTATQEELQTIKQAIVGNPAAVAAGVHVDRGFLGDIGFVPSRLEDLVAKPDSLSVYNPITRLGWNGPYMDSAGGNYLTDAWGNGYVYTPGSRSILSTGGGSDTIRVTF